MNTQALVDYLNAILVADEDAISEVLEHRVPANMALINSVCLTSELRTVSLLGIINGFLVVQGQPRIAACYDDQRQLTKFVVYTQDS